MIVNRLTGAEGGRSNLRFSAPESGRDWMAGCGGSGDSGIVSGAGDMGPRRVPLFRSVGRRRQAAILLFLLNTLERGKYALRFDG